MRRRQPARDHARRAGALKSSSHSEPFIDIDKDPLTEKSSRIGTNWYFPSYLGRVQVIAADKEVARVADTWWLTTDQERKDGWRPAGWHWSAGHPDGRLFVGMIPNGYPVVTKTRRPKCGCSTWRAKRGGKDRAEDGRQLRSKSPPMLRRACSLRT